MTLSFSTGGLSETLLTAFVSRSIYVETKSVSLISKFDFSSHMIRISCF